MGDCPCPRCLISKKRMNKLGSKLDQLQRRTLAREDDLQHRVHIEMSRDMIYQQNRAVDSVFVERVLKSESLVPTAVKFDSVCNIQAILTPYI